MSSLQATVKGTRLTTCSLTLFMPLTTLTHIMVTKDWNKTKHFSQEKESYGIIGWN